MANDFVKYVSVLIPEDALNEWEQAKTVTINGVIYVVPVGAPVKVPDFVAEVINQWISEVKKAREDYKKRMDELKEAFK